MDFKRMEGFAGNIPQKFADGKCQNDLGEEQLIHIGHLVNAEGK